MNDRGRRTAARALLIAACLGGAGSAAAAEAPPVALEAPPREPTDVRIRSTVAGTLIGAGAGLLAGLVIGVDLCNMKEDNSNGRLCGPTERFVVISGIIGLFGAASGAVGGGVVGAGIPSRRPAGHRPRFWEQASGELGTLAIHLGSTNVLGQASAGKLSGAVRASMLAKIGAYFALGPELGFYPQVRRSPYASQVPEPDEDHATVVFGGAFRVGVPLGRFQPYAALGLGYYNGLYGNIGGSVGLGGEWRIAPRWSLAAEARLHGNLDALGEPFANLTAGAAWHW